MGGRGVLGVVVEAGMVAVVGGGPWTDVWCDLERLREKVTVPVLERVKGVMRVSC